MFQQPYIPQPITELGGHELVQRLIDRVGAGSGLPERWRDVSYPLLVLGGCVVPRAVHRRVFVSGDCQIGSLLWSGAGRPTSKQTWF